MNNSTTHYQTSFRVADDDGEAFMRLKAGVYGWVLSKENDPIIRNAKSDFFSRCDWRNLKETRSYICTASYFMEANGAWAFHCTEIDKECGRKRFWYSDVGIKKDSNSVIVSIRISFAWNDEDLSHVQEPPAQTVPKVVRFIIQKNYVYSGRREFRLVEKPIEFKEVGMGKALCDFIQSPERRYPLVVFNGNGVEHVKEANSLAREMTGKAIIALVTSDDGLAQEMREYLTADYRIPFGQFRIFFPFDQRRNSPRRHRWYDVSDVEYDQQRHGIINGLLRSHTLLEKGAVETIEDIYALVSRSKLQKLEAASPEQQKQLNDFLEEHAKVAAERDQAKQDASFFAAEYDRLDDEIKKLEWRCKDYQQRLVTTGSNTGVNMATVMRKLPETLLDAAIAAKAGFPRLVITEDAVKTAGDFHECGCVAEAWEMFVHLSETLYPMKFERQEKDLEGKFNAATRYELAMSEGKMTKRDSKLMRLRKLNHNGKEFDITPHLKYGNASPKLVRIHFAFDEEAKKIVIGHIGRHIPNYTTKKM